MLLSNYTRKEICHNTSQLEKVNFRPITVLPALSTTFEHILYQQLADHFGKISQKYMFGYRKYYGRPTALLSLTEQWNEDLDKHNIIDTIAIDLSKALDCLAHDLILEKLKFRHPKTQTMQTADRRPQTVQTM